MSRWLQATSVRELYAGGPLVGLVGRICAAWTLHSRSALSGQGCLSLGCPPKDARGRQVGPVGATQGQGVARPRTSDQAVQNPTLGVQSLSASSANASMKDSSRLSKAKVAGSLKSPRRAS
jgi:hypothetical protein